MPDDLTLVHEGIAEEHQGKIMSPAMQERGLTGVCCAFAMDWAARRLSGMKTTANLYKLEHVRASLAKQQARQLEGGFQSVAAGYGLKMLDSFALRLFRNDGWKTTKELKPLVYYVSCSNGSYGPHRIGHGFAVDFRGAEAGKTYLGDAYSGVCESDGGTLSIVRAHLLLLKDMNLRTADIYPLFRNGPQTVKAVTPSATRPRSNSILVRR